MFVDAIKIAKEAVFPIFRVDQHGSNQVQWSVKGSGFFISPEGHFVSVAHVFDNTTPQTSFMYLGQVPERVQNPPLPIVEVARDDLHDIYIGKINIKPPNYFTLSEGDAQIGRSVCIVGYPLAALAANSGGGLEVGGARRYIQPSFVLDLAQADSDNGAGRIRKHIGFFVRDVGLFGMSGGPVFDTGGCVIGMQASVTPPRVSQGGGRTIAVENALAISSHSILNFARSNGIKVTSKPSQIHRLLKKKIQSIVDRFALVTHK